MNRVYCLYRVSDITQSEKNDIPMQKIACHAFAESKGWKIIREFTEIGISGYKVSADERDAIVEIREDAIVDKFDILLVFMFDRIGRRDDETPFVVEWFSRHEISIWSVCEGEQRFDSHTDKLINYIRFWQASGESQKISERTRTRMRQLTAEGFFTGGRPPYGYTLCPGKRLNKRGMRCKDLCIEEDEAGIVRLMFNKAAQEGYGSYRIARFLNESGILTRSGKQWRHTSIANILKNPIYLGILRKGGINSPVISQLSIIDHDTFQFVHKLYYSRSDESKGRSPIQSRSDFLLSGMLYCAHCGSRMGGTTRKRVYEKCDGNKTITRIKRYICARCQNGFPCLCSGQHTYSAKKIEDLFNEKIFTMKEEIIRLTPEVFAAKRFGTVMSSLKTKLNENEIQCRILDDNYVTLASEYANALRSTSTASLNIKTIADMKLALDIKRKDLNALHTKLEGAVAQVESIKRGFQVKAEKYQNLLRSYSHVSIGEKRMLLFQLISRIEVNCKYEISIFYHKDFEDFINGNFLD